VSKTIAGDLPPIRVRVRVRLWIRIRFRVRIIAGGLSSEFESDAFEV